jgi:hypothetical protein
MRKALLLPIGFLVLLSYGAHAKMAAMHQGSKEKITGDQAEIALLARVGAETGIAETAAAPYTENEDAAIPQVSSNAILASMRTTLGAQKEWKPLSSALRKYVKKNRGSLKSAFGENSYLWAWAEFQLKDEGEARNILRGLYTAEFDRVMKLKKAEYVFGRGPLDDAELYLHALVPLVEPTEARKLNEQMKDMKVHLSNVPESRVMT